MPVAYRVTSPTDPPQSREYVEVRSPEIPNLGARGQELEEISRSAHLSSERGSPGPALSLLARGNAGGISGDLSDPPRSREYIEVRSPEIPNLGARRQELGEISRSAHLSSERGSPALCAFLHQMIQVSPLPPPPSPPPPSPLPPPLLPPTPPSPPPPSPSPPPPPSSSPPPPLPSLPPLSPPPS